MIHVDQPIPPLKPAPVQCPCVRLESCHPSLSLVICLPSTSILSIFLTFALQEGGSRFLELVHVCLSVLLRTDPLVRSFARSLVRSFDIHSLSARADHDAYAGGTSQVSSCPKRCTLRPSSQHRLNFHAHAPRTAICPPHGRALSSLHDLTNTPNTPPRPPLIHPLPRHASSQI
jgi:hypothetical protein